MNRRDMNKIKTLPITRTIWVSCLSHFLHFAPAAKIDS